ncbi:MAG: homoserine O-acetyltransferase [Verrucomicrobia bacterium]|nr:homoserine O-acetyltransferase [Verrucomicrobiota bacterium]
MFAVMPDYRRYFECENEFEMHSGARLPRFTLAYETYGELNEDRSNAVLILHALTGDSHLAKHDPDDVPGWWEKAVGPGLAFDTNKYFVICSNVLGGCKGSTGPASINPKTGKPYALSFPIVTVSDMVRAQKLLLDHLGIDSLLAVCGGSVGGMQAIQWVVSYPESVRNAIVLASTACVSPQTIGFNEVARQAIYADPNWKFGEYYDGEPPNRGLAVARMIGHITYLSEASMHAKFGRRLQEREQFGYDFATEFAVESYLRYRGDSFTQRFDANSFLYMTKAIDYFDLSHGLDALSEAFQQVTSRMLVVSYTSDWLFPSAQSKELVRALLQSGVDAAYVEIKSNYGHDAFLLESERLCSLTRDFLSRPDIPAGAGIEAEADV